VLIPALMRSGRLWLAAGLIMASAWGLFRVWEPGDEAARSICIVRQTTGVSCPGCGLTRGFASLAKFEVGRSIQRHPLTPVFALEAVLLWLGWGVVAWGRITVPSAGSIDRFLVLHAGLLVGVWLFRISTGDLPGGSVG
jgi:hypothetical protein